MGMILEPHISKELALKKAKERRQEAISQKDFALSNLLRALIRLIEQPWGPGQPKERKKS
jgi:hypothetical protein